MNKAIKLEVSQTFIYKVVFSYRCLPHCPYVPYFVYCEDSSRGCCEGLNGVVALTVDG